MVNLSIFVDILFTFDSAMPDIVSFDLPNQLALI